MPVRVVVAAMIPATVAVMVIATIITAVVARVRAVKATPRIIAAKTKYRRSYNGWSHHHIYVRARSGCIIIVLHRLLGLLLSI